MQNDLEIILYRPGDGTESIADELWAILTIVDKDFVPSLAARRDTTELEMTEIRLWASPLPFFETLMREYVFLARQGGEIVGVSSFIPHYREQLLSPWSPSTYVSTTAVLPRFRRQGIGRSLNKALVDLPDDLRSPFITRRTWSTNTANLRLLDAIGFEEVVRLRDHRRPGVDTLYLAARTDEVDL